jgi:octaprenyl-diphosphate synthase
LDIFEKIRLELSVDIEQINSIVLENIRVPDELVTQMTDYILKRKSKKIRPIITLLVSKMVYHQSISAEAIYIAAAVELVHIATLLHDDVIDSGKIRNGRKSLNQIWGNKASILAGDFLFSQAFKFMVKAKSLKALDLLSNSSSIISEGEISQLRLQNEKKIIDIEEYFDVIKKKTAVLFSSAAACVAIANNCSDETISQITNFGLFFGMIFQISDDLLDYTGNPQEIGKSIGSDFFESKVTLPIIIAYGKSTEGEKEFWQKTFFMENKNDEDLAYATSLLEKYKVVDDIYEIMLELKQKAIKSLCDIKQDNYHKNLLLDLLDFCILRKN